MVKRLLIYEGIRHGPPAKLAELFQAARWACDLTNCKNYPTENTQLRMRRMPIQIVLQVHAVVVSVCGDRLEFSEKRSKMIDRIKANARSQEK